MTMATASSAALAAAASRRPKEVVILGGGISGLTAAWSMIRSAGKRTSGGSALQPPRITIVEPEPELGGMMSTVYGPGGTILEQGPRTIRPGGLEGRATLNLVSSIGLTSEVLVPGKNHPGINNRYIYAKGKLTKIPGSFPEIVTKFLQGDFLARAMVTGVLTEPFASKASSRHFSNRLSVINEDESVYDFACRRLNRDVASYLMDPLCVGIFGCDARRLSLKSCFPILAEFEGLEGSLLLGAIRNDVNSKPLPPPEPGTEDLLEKVKGARVWALQHGISSLPKALEKWLVNSGHVNIFKGARCESLSLNGESGTISVSLDSKTHKLLEADHVLSTLSPQALSPIIQRVDEDGSTLLQSMPSHSCVVVNFVFRGALSPVDGFGYLVPTTEPDNKILGVVFDSCTVPAQDDPYHTGSDLGMITRLTVMSGGYMHNDLYGDTIDEDYAIHISLEALRKQIGITADPIHAEVRPWINCMPEYLVGHENRREQLMSHVSGTWGGKLTLIGNAFYGAGVNHCVRRATMMGETLVSEDVV